MAKTYQIPFDKNGNQMHYPEPSWLWNKDGTSRQIPPTLKDNYVFEDTLIIEDFSRGRSAAYIEAKSATTGKGFTIFLKDLLDIIKNETISKGVVQGKWTFCKRGSNFGLKRV
jgi:hypothetical protein